MMTKHVLATAVMFGTTVLVSAQAPPPARPATLDDVVGEVRALRADIQRMEDVSVRAQLLVARLQVQEQRIAGIARELSETETQLRALDMARNPFAEKMLKDLSAEPAKPEDAEMVAALKSQLEKLQNGDPTLKERQASLSRLLADEQARWTAFNAQLEALERELPVLKRK